LLGLVSAYCFLRFGFIYSKLETLNSKLKSAFRFLPSAFYILHMPKPPDWIQPMAATLTQERFTGPEWIFEGKFDGIRLLAHKRGAKVELFSRNRLPQNIPALACAIAELPHRELILDGEIDWHGPAAYHVFDILWIDGRNVTELPLEERQALLKKLPLKPPLHRVTALKDSAVTDETPWERAQREGWEGVIAKRHGSIYEPRRSPNWLKMKVELSQEFVVGGFTDPRGKRVGLGALLVGYYERESEPPAVAGGRASLISGRASLGVWTPSSASGQ
jgi:ATP-dependent DNA ligase